MARIGILGTQDQLPTAIYGLVAIEPLSNRSLAFPRTNTCPLSLPQVREPGERCRPGAYLVNL